MERNANKLQVEVMSPSNVLANYSSSTRIGSYLAGKSNMTANLELGKNTSPITSQISPKSTLNVRFPEGDAKARGFSVETPSLVSPIKKEPESFFYLKSPLISATDAKKPFAFNNFMMESNEKRRAEVAEKHFKSMKCDDANLPDSKGNLKLVRNNSMNKLSGKAPNISETIESQKNVIRRVMERQNCELNLFTPKTFLVSNQPSNSNNLSANTGPFQPIPREAMLSPKQAKMDRVYEQIRLFQSARKKDLDKDKSPEEKVIEFISID